MTHLNGGKVAGSLRWSDKPELAAAAVVVVLEKTSFVTVLCRVS